MSNTALSTRSKSDVYLIGSTKEELRGTKLPSVGDVLGLYLHNVSSSKTKHAAATKTIESVKVFWEMACIPTRPIQHAIKHLEALVGKWAGLKKNKKRQTDTQIAKENAFKETLNDLFDIAHQDALNLITITEDKKFLLAQRDKGRRGSMVGVDKVLAKKEEAIERKRKTKTARVQKSKTQESIYEKDVILESSSESSDKQNSFDFKDEVPVQKERKHKSKKARCQKSVLSPSVLSSLDRTKTSLRNSVHTIAAVLSTTGEDIDDYALSKSSIHRSRLQHRVQRSKELKECFQSNEPLTLHWDGKLMQDLTGDEKVDRLPILVSGCSTDQLLCVSKLPSGTGKATADALLDAVTCWGIKDKIRAISFDTTASNTGQKNGACVLFEYQLEQDILYLPCRHHIHEIILEEAFHVTMGPSSGPEILLFKRFKSFWVNIDPSSYICGTEDEFVMTALQRVHNSVITFAEEQLQENHPRDDYKELLELTIMFLGEVPHRGVHFSKPGAIHRARFMARLIYALKVFMFRESFQLSTKELRGLRDFSIFGIEFYVKSWFKSGLSTLAPGNDLLLMKALALSSTPAAKGALKKLSGHLWYLSEELVAFAFFDRQLDIADKRAMVKALEKQGDENQLRRIQLDQANIEGSLLCSFVTKNTIKFFDILDIPKSFLSDDPQTWITNEDYLKAEASVKHLRVVNDTAERGVALMNEYNGLLTKGEDQTQFVLQVVREHRKRFPDASKGTVLHGLAE